MDKPEYIRWLVEEKGIIENNSIPLKCFKINYNKDEDVLTDWALHIRRHYVSDIELKEDSYLLDMSPEEYLKEYVIPQKGVPLGATARSNTITEIIVSDLLEFIYGYHVPRIRQRNMSGTTVSEHGTDVIGYKFENVDKTPSKKDRLVAAEVKAVLSKADTSVIKKAIEDSPKDEYRVALSLNYMRKKLKQFGMNDESKDIERFQLKTKHDYLITYIPAGITSLEDLMITTIDGKNVQIIPGLDGGEFSVCAGQCLFFVHGKELMKLTHEIYERCTK